MANNKVKYNIKNVHYAVATSEGTYETPVPMPGAVSLTLEQQGELSPFYADGIKYYVSSSNGGYEGDLELALVPDSFREDVLGEIPDSKGVLFENVNTPTVNFALGFEVDGDVTPIKFWFYNCTATRPNIDAATTEDTKEPGTDTLTISATSTSDGTVRAKTTDTVDQETLTSWYTTVYQEAGE